MPKFTVEQQSSLPQNETFTKIKSFLSNEELSKMAPGAKLTFDESKNQARIEGPQFKANLDVQSAGTGSKVVVLVDLGFLLTPFKGKVEETLKKQLARHIG